MLNLLHVYTEHLIVGQVFDGADPWATWPIHICWPMTNCLLWFFLTVTCMWEDEQQWV